MKNPLYRRIPREFRRNLGKNIAMLLFLTLTIGFCSGYFIATGSISKRLSENYDNYLTEDGHFILSSPIDSPITKAVNDNDADVYDLFFKDKTLPDGHTMRLYPLRTKVDLMQMYSGDAPEKTGEIAIDRLYARNNNIQIGDTLRIERHEFKVTGFSVVPDYTSLYKNNTDFMFDALSFCVGFMVQEDFDALSDNGMNYCYAWMYRDRSLSENEKHSRAESIMEDIAKVCEKELTEYRTMLAGQGSSGTKDMTQPPVLTDFVPSDSNSAINMAANDVGGDRVIALTFMYVTIAVIALAAGITTKSTVQQEASVIGTLRASGYRRGEIVGHYMLTMVLTTFIAAILGNIFGYTFMNGLCSSLYYGSYSFPHYTPIITGEAFMYTTFVPVAIVLAVELLMLFRLLSLPPLQFLRKELKRKKKSKSIPLPAGGFTLRFRLRVILRNYQAYIVLFVGILFANFLLMFSLIWNPMLENFHDVVLDNVIAQNQYILKTPAETKTPDAEKFAVYALENDKGESITIYGITPDSKYVRGPEFDGDKFYFSSAYEEKYSIHEGDSIHFTEKFSDNEYTFTNSGSYDYPPALCVFTGIENFRNVFGMDKDYYSGYFSDSGINDIDDADIATVIGLSDLTKSADQLSSSVGFVQFFSIFAVAVYILMMYILSKMITERNTHSISILKIMGYTNREISGLYNLSTGAVVLFSMLISMPIVCWSTKIVYHIMMQEFNGWLTFYLDPWLSPVLFVIGIACFMLVYLLEMRRIRAVPLNVAIKDIE